MMTRTVSRGLWVLLGVVIVSSGLIGCGDQALKDENLTLQTSLKRADLEKADLQAQLKATQAEDEQLKADLVAARGAKVPMSLGPKPNFGEGVEVSEDVHGITVTLPETVLFESGRAELKSSSKQTLEKIAGVIKKDYSGRLIRVEGHTDTDPIKKSNWKDNWELSCERSLAVTRFLTREGGIDPRGVYAAGFGEFMPRSKEKAHNRRVQIVITREPLTSFGSTPVAPKAPAGKAPPLPALRAPAAPPASAAPGGRMGS
jgi:chemotaxis protein MotB